MPHPSRRLSLLLPLLACSGGPKGPDTGACPEGWAMSFGTALDDEIWGVATAADGDAFVGGFETTTSQTQAVLSRLSPDGELRWRAEWGGDWSEKGFVVVPDGASVYLGGTQWTSLDLLDTTAFLARFDATSGELQADTTWTSDGWDEIDGVVPLDDGVLVSGWSSEGDDPQLRVARLDDALEPVWDVTWGSDGTDELNGHLVVIGEVAYGVGRWEGVGGFLYGDAVFFALDITSGERLWTTTDGDALAYDDALGLATDGEALYAVGYGDIAGDGKNLRLWALDLDGELRWETDWGGAGTEAGRAIGVDATGDLIVAANTDSDGDGASDIALLRVRASDGEILDEARFGGASEDAAHDVALDGETVWISAETSSFGAGLSDGLVLRGCLDPLSLPDPSAVTAGD